MRVFDHWSTHRSVRDLRRVFQATELLAYPRGFAPSRKIQDRRRTLSLPPSFALLRWLRSPLLGFWMVERSPGPLNSDRFFLSMSIDAPESTTKSLSSGFLADGAGKHTTSECE